MISLTRKIVAQNCEHVYVLSCHLGSNIEEFCDNCEFIVSMIDKT